MNNAKKRYQIPNAIYKMDGNEIKKSTVQGERKKNRAYEVHRSNKSLFIFIIILFGGHEKQKADKQRRKESQMGETKGTITYFFLLIKYFRSFTPPFNSLFVSFRIAFQSFMYFSLVSILKTSHS